MVCVAVQFNIIKPDRGISGAIPYCCANLSGFFYGEFAMNCKHPTCPLLEISLIPLTQGLFSIVDDEDYEYLMQWKWQTQFNHCGIPYAVRQGIRMHRLLSGLQKGDGKIVDHRNCNSLDNRRHNLRICTNSQNCMNSKPRKGSSIYKGVTLHAKSQKWQAQVHFRGKHIRAGSYHSEVAAAKAYDAKAKELAGEFARTNFE